MKADPAVAQNRLILDVHAEGILPGDVLRVITRTTPGALSALDASRARMRAWTLPDGPGSDLRVRTQSTSGG